MAKVTITVEDLDNGKVKITAEPNFMTIMKIDISGNHLTPAHGYALRMMNEAMRVSKENNPENLIQIPRVRRAH